MLKVFPSKWCVGFSSYFAFFFFSLLLFFLRSIFLFLLWCFFLFPYPQSNSPRYCSWIQTTFFHFLLSSIFFSIFMKLFHFPYSHSLFFYLSVSHFENIFLLLCVLLLISYDFLMFRIFLSICFVSLAYAQAFWWCNFYTTVMYSKLESLSLAIK